MGDEHPKQDNFPKLSVFQKKTQSEDYFPHWTGSFLIIIWPPCPSASLKLGHFGRRHIGKELMKEFVNECMDF